MSEPDPTPMTRHMTDDEIELLEAAARAVLPNAYAPYSRYPVSAAVLADPDHVHLGVNVENSSFPLGACAEKSAVANAVTAGHRNLRGVVILTAGQTFGAPCGACRQVLREFADPSLHIVMVRLDGSRKETTLGDLLPMAFRANDMDREALAKEPVQH